MNLDSLSFDLSQISYSVANVTKKNFKTVIQELSALTAKHGSEGERHLLRCLFSHVDFGGDGKSCGKDSYQTQYLIQECSSLISKPHFISSCCYAIDNPLHQQKSLKPSPQLLNQISRVLKFSKVQEVIFALALHQSSIPELHRYSEDFVADKLPDLLKSYVDSETRTSDQQTGFEDCSPEVIHFLLAHLHRLTSDNQNLITSELKELFLASLRKDYPRELAPLVVEPLLFSGKLDIAVSKVTLLNTTMPMEAELAEIVRDMGYNFTSSVEECRTNLKILGIPDLTPSNVAKILSLMAKTHSGLSDSVLVQQMNAGIIWNDNKEKNDMGQASSWNVDIFVHVVKELHPFLNWREVVLELDHPGFLLKDRSALKLLWCALEQGLGDETLPMEHMYRRWKNVEGQLSFFQQCLKNSDLVCFMEHQCRAVAVDVLKAPPEEDSRDVANWKSLNLLETLLYLSDAGHYALVQELFKFPVQNCPDLAVLGLLQVTAPMNMLRQELLTTLIPIFFGNHPNAAIILQYAWHCQAHSSTVKPIIMHSMAEWYMRGECDQTRLSRILDVAQDLKALSALLNGNHFPFVIDLACLASRREYLKLDKWLMDKIMEHREQFLQACVSFLKRRCPQIIMGASKEEGLPKSAQLPPETLTTMLSCLQACTNSVSRDLSETIVTMVGNCNILLNKTRQPPPGVVKAPRGLEPTFPSSSVSAVSTTSLDTLAGLSTSISNLSLSSSIATSVGGNNTANSFITSGLSSFTSSVAVGSPAKLFPNPTPSSTSSSPAVTSAIGHNPFSSFPSQLGHFNSQLGSVRYSVYPGAGEVGNLLGDMASIFPDISLPISKDIEDEANGYFQRIYNHPPNATLSIDEVLEMLKRYQESLVKRERDVFSCMVRNLFEEYRFFPQYPDKELLITAQLFGGIIDQALVTYMSLGLALRCVLDALRKPHGSKMYYFGITALDRFKAKLKEYPQYCQHLASIPHFQDFPQHLIEYVEYGARSQEPPSRPQGVIGTNLSNMASIMPAPASTARTSTSTTVTVTTTVAKPTTLSGKPSIANATNIDTLLVATKKDEKMVVPPEAIQDKMAFIVNNLSQINLTQKTEEFKDLMREEYYIWAAQYLVLKRASIEHNFHTLYSNFLDTLKMPELAKLVVKETFRNIKVLLRTDKGSANFSDRSLLKNLGHWLGMLTLGKNKPIFQVDIDIKALLVEAYHNGQQELLYVVPFVAKVLDSCAKSKVFRPPNPWTMGIMNVLAEMHQETGLKLNLKFEIEVLCKTLSIDINELKPGTVLKDMDQLTRIDTQLSPLPKQHVDPIQVIAIAPSHHIQPTQLPPSTVPSSISMETSIIPVEDTMVSVAPVHLGGNQFLSGPTTPPSGSSGAPVTPVPASLQKPQFAYNEIMVLSTNGLSQHIQVNNQVPLFQSYPHLKKVVKQAIEQAVQEWIAPVVDRCITISLTTCEQIVKKDFALDPEESRLRLAAHHMIRNLTAGMTMITCRDPILHSISSNLKRAFHSSLVTRGIVVQQKELVELAASMVARDNVELACCFVQKTAIEKAVTEMDKRLANEIELRKQARSEGRRYCDPGVLTYQAERMPEQIRLKVGGVTPLQMSVYEEFYRNIPGFMPSDKETQNFPAKPVPVIHSYAVDELTQIYDKIIAELDLYLHSLISNQGNHQVAALHSLMEAVVLARNSREGMAPLALVTKAVEGLLDGLNQIAVDPEVTLRFRDGHLFVLKALADARAYGHSAITKLVTRCLIECRDECKFNLDAVDCLIRSHLVNMQTYDLYLAKLIDNGGNYMAIHFAMQLLRLYLIDERNGAVTEFDLFSTMESLFRMASHPRTQPEGLPQLLEVLRSSNDSNFLDRAPGGPISMMHSGISQAREFDDPPGLHEKTEFLLREWVTVYHSSNSSRDSTKAFTIFVHQMNLQGILKTDDLITRFFRLSTEMCVDLCYRALSDQTQLSMNMTHSKCFYTLDAYVRLIALLVKHSGDANNTMTKVNLLNKVLGIVTGVLLQDHEVRNTEFQQLPYHRIFIMLFLELTGAEPILEAISFQILTAFCNTFHILRPSKASGFVYAWLELTSHRTFLSRVLAQTPQQKAWGLFAQLLVDLFKFLSPFLRNVELPKPISLLYKGTLRVLLVLLHDFPEFLCDYHYSFCDVIPPNCIQMRNLILSAFPRNMRLPDPFTPNLKVDMLQEIMQAPRVLTSYASMIHPPSFKKDLDSYIQTRSPVTFLSDLRSNLQVSNEPGMRYNIPLINALVLYVGTQAIAFIQNKGLTPSMVAITHSSHMDIFQNLAVDLDTEGRYLFLNAMANQLRYPNSHTHYFSCTLLYLFAEANTEAIQEQITRVLLERLIVNRPHPWGLLVTFIELIKNSTFKFWNHEFVRCAPEIEKLFESVARSCMQQKPPLEPTST